MALTRLEALDRIARIWGKDIDSLEQMISGAWHIHFEKEGYMHELDANGHTDCHAECATLEAQRIEPGLRLTLDPMPPSGLFVRFECGCIGLSGQPAQRAIVLVLCDGDRDTPADSLDWIHRNMRGKTITPLDGDATALLNIRIARRFAKADRFDEIRLALGLRDEVAP